MSIDFLLSSVILVVSRYCNVLDLSKNLYWKSLARTLKLYISVQYGTNCIFVPVPVL